MLATVASATVLGAAGRPITVEVHLASGLPSFVIVGLPDTACREARDRVRAAVLCSGATWPPQRITVNLAPVGVRKAGSGLDLPIAVGVLAASGVVPAEALAGRAFVGELGLDGSLRAVPGVVPLVDAAGAAEAVVPRASASEAALVPGVAVRGFPSLAALVETLVGEAPWPPPADPPVPGACPPVDDLADVRGQPTARLALEVAAAGGHHLLLVGPPGAGKTMLAQRLVGLLPPLGPAAALEVARVHSAAGLTPVPALTGRPPFRAPHHTSTVVSVVGGGTGALRPGEISLAHEGVLFLDELGEFPAVLLDSLRQPLEEGVVRVSRAHERVELPARFLLVGATNPCPCGAAGPPGSCRCSDAGRARYLRRLSGPLLDRFDLRVVVTRSEPAELLARAPGEDTATVAARVARARARAAQRGVLANARLRGPALEAAAPLTEPARRLLAGALGSGTLSARGLTRVRRVARTLVDLRPGGDAGADGPVDEEAVALALSLRTTRLFGMEHAA